MRVTHGVVLGFPGLGGPGTAGPGTRDSGSGLVDGKASTEGLYVGRTTLGWIVVCGVFSWAGFCDSVSDAVGCPVNRQIVFGEPMVSQYDRAVRI